LSKYAVIHRCYLFLTALGSFGGVTLLIGANVGQFNGWEGCTALVLAISTVVHCVWLAARSSELIIEFPWTTEYKIWKLRQKEQRLKAFKDSTLNESLSQRRQALRDAIRTLEQERDNKAAYKELKSSGKVLERSLK
jgi:hypothetical protein